ncbi:hypothetical protein N0V82_007762 [Gnomoniopsis sp. IMI 355080]|nr:hypothetical protein N0V82_007762 [Gnomoniopsis sp. IMI 355080]
MSGLYQVKDYLAPLSSLGSTQKSFSSDFPTPSPPSPCDLDALRRMTAEADQSNIFGGFGAVIGYIGGEAATADWFERLLWPQRFFSGFRLASVPSVALLLPMGGPLHKAALSTLDVMHHHGLMKGAYRGHMLGTPFFRSQDWSYTMHGNEFSETHTEPLRNCLWARAISLLPVGEQVVTKSSLDEEKGTRPQSVLRAQVAVNHLTLSWPTTNDRSRLPFVPEPSGTPNLRVYLGIITAEATAIIVALALAVTSRTTWSILFLVPLFLRLLSASLAIHREKLLSPKLTVTATDPPVDFEVHCPQSDGSFMMITGPPTLVLQFVRHFGHPVRSRWREVTQLACIAAFGLFYPFGLLCSMVWMPLSVQCVWLSYETYLIAAMHVARYTWSGLGSTTEARIAQALMSPEAREAGGKEGASILFGHEVYGEGTVKAMWSATYHTRNAEGKKAMQGLLRRRKMNARRWAPRPISENQPTETEKRRGLPHSDSTDSTDSDKTLHGDGDPDPTKQISPKKED